MNENITKEDLSSQADTPKGLMFGPLHLWEFAGCWVRAATEADARQRLEDQNAGDGSRQLHRMLGDDEPFTMQYEDADAIPKGAEPDSTCECTPENLEKFGCECDASDNAVTMPAGWWANRKDQEWVTYELNDEFLG